MLALIVAALIGARRDFPPSLPAPAADLPPFVLTRCAMAALGTAEYLLYANFAALADDCAHQASVWAWTAVAVPTLVLGPFVLASFKMTYCASCLCETPSYAVPHKPKMHPVTFVSTSFVCSVSFLLLSRLVQARRIRTGKRAIHLCCPPLAWRCVQKRAAICEGCEGSREVGANLTRGTNQASSPAQFSAS